MRTSAPELVTMAVGVRTQNRGRLAAAGAGLSAPFPLLPVSRRPAEGQRAQGAELEKTALGRLGVEDGRPLKHDPSAVVVADFHEPAFKRKLGPQRDFRADFQPAAPLAADNLRDLADQRRPGRQQPRPAAGCL